MRLMASSKGLIGVDITSATVKLVELRRAGATYQVESYAVRPLREGAVVERRIQDMGEVVDALTRAVQQAKPHTRKVVVSVPASAAITKTLTLPASLSDDEIESRIQLDSDKHIPFPFSEVAFDFQRLGLNARYADQQDVLLVACRQQDVSQLTDAVMQSGLTPAAVDVETFAMERAYREAAASGASAVEFKEAVLSLEVTPQITPDNRIIMDVAITNDTFGEFNPGEEPPINKNEIETQVLVDNGETVVLGGILQTEELQNLVKTPFLGDIPVLGNLFRYTQESNDKVELLVFITPRILDDGVALR